MKKFFIFGLFGLAIATIVLISLFEFSRSEPYIKNEIENTNYCDVKEDCVLAGGQCPFGCYVYVNINEVSRIKDLITSFKSNCNYECMYCPNVKCKNKKCEPVCQ